jgi:arginyl-tRNA synthetase
MVSSQLHYSFRCGAEKHPLGEPKAIAQWSRFRDLSIERLKETYERLNIHFDVFWGESQVKEESMQRAIKIVQEKNLVCEDRGALLVDLEKYKLEKAIVRKGGESHGDFA